MHLTSLPRAIRGILASMPLRLSNLPLLAVLLLSFSGAANAQDLGGEWTASKLTIRHSIGSWGPDCGRQPPAVMSEKGGKVNVTVQGDQLVFSGAVRGKTNGCWTQTPGAKRTTTKVSGGTWTTSCKTPTSHAHPERGTYTIRNSGGKLSFQERTSYDWQLNTSRCVATRTATRSFSRAAPPEPEPAEEPDPVCTAGPATSLRLTAAKNIIKPGERLCFRARVIDDKGCPLKNQKIRFAVAPKARMGGRCFYPTAEGRYRITATSGAFKASSAVSVMSEDLSSLTAQRERQRLLEEAAAAEGQASSGLNARIGNTGVSYGMALLGLVLALLGALAAFLLYRRRVAIKMRKKECPTCQEIFAPDMLTCPNDGSDLIDARKKGEVGPGSICPTCRRGFSSVVVVCPHDASQLVPYKEFVQRQKQSQQASKTCPTCGESYQGNVAFCPKDGATLETN